jgi:isoleucyl-tRNA synthetase
LVKEGIARDLVNRIQNMRKDMGLEVQDKIRIRVQKNGSVATEAIEAHKGYICRETQALSLEMEAQVPDGQELEMDAHKVIVKIEA